MRSFYFCERLLYNARARSAMHSLYLVCFFFHIIYVELFSFKLIHFQNLIHRLARLTGRHLMKHTTV